MVEGAKTQIFVTGESPAYRAAFAAHSRLNASRQNLQELHGLYLSDNRDEALARSCDFYLIRRAAPIP